MEWMALERAHHFAWVDLWRVELHVYSREGGALPELSRVIDCYIPASIIWVLVKGFHAMIYFGPSRRLRLETYEQFRQRLLDETSAFIEWGLNNPNRVPRIPTHPVGMGDFSRRIKTFFWNYVFEQEFGPPGY